MSHMNDIPELYKRFDGNAGDYQELRRGDLAADAQKRWPLVAAVASAPVVMPPSVFCDGAPVQDAVHGRCMAPAHAVATPTLGTPKVAAGATPTLPSQDQAARRASLRARFAAAWRSFQDEGRS